MQLGRGVSFSNNFSTAPSVMFAAMKNLRKSSDECTMSTFSTPSGNPTSLPGNRSCTKRIGCLDSVDQAIDFWTLPAL
ncbi:hypothetical protein V6N13_006285 [Hibiscus sabdariffa]